MIVVALTPLSPTGHRVAGYATAKTSASNFDPQRIRKNFPAVLHNRRQWVCWRYEVRDGRNTKVPMSPYVLDRRASSTNPEDWSDLNTAIRAIEQSDGKLDGVGFVFTNEDDLLGVDLDHCLENDAFLGESERIVEGLNTYTERSVSGDGVHLLAIGDLNAPGGKRIKVQDTLGFCEVEMYEHGRFFVVTGDHIKGTPKYLRKAQPEIDTLRGELWSEAAVEKDIEAPEAASLGSPAPADALDDDALVQRMMTATNAEKFKKLWSGDISEYGGDDSRADMALCSILAFWTGRDANRMDRLFRQSGLMRDKWDAQRGGVTYGQRTTDTAVRECREVWSPGSRSGGKDRQPLHHRFPDLALPEQLVIPWMYEISDRGVHCLHRKKKKQDKAESKDGDHDHDEQNDDADDKPKKRLISATPFFPVADLQDIDAGTVKLRLKVWRQGRFEDVIVDAAEVADKRKIVELANHGIDVTSDTAGDLVKYLQTFRRANRKTMPVERATTHLGWTPHGFLLGTRFFPQPGHEHNAVQLSANDEYRRMAARYTANGTIEQWRHDVLRPTVIAPRTRAAMYAAAASPILELLDQPGFTVDLAGETSRGKTTSLGCAASIFGPGGDRGPVQGWDATAVGVERLAGFQHHLPLLMDDTKQAKPWVVAEMLYGVANGQGRTRGKPDGMRRTETWRLIMISTGESPITGFAHEGDGGAHARVVQLFGSPLGEGQGELADRLKAATAECYGVVGQRLIEQMVGMGEDLDDLRQRYRQALAYWQSQAGDAGPARRVAAYFAVLELGGKLLHQAAADQAHIGEVRDCLAAVWPEAIAAAGERADQAREAMEKVVEWCVANPARFDQTNGGAGRTGLAGFFGGVELTLIPSVIEDEILPGHNLTSLLKTWRDRNWIKTDGTHLKIKRKFNGARDGLRCVAIDRRALAEAGITHDDPGEAIKPDPQPKFEWPV